MGRSTALLISMFAILSAYPFLEPFALMQRLVDATFALVVLWALYGAASRRVFWVTCPAVVAGVVNGLTIDLDTASGIPVARYAGNAIVLGVVAASTLADTLRSRRVTVEQVAGALAVYLLIGIVWGHLYALLDGLQPGAIALDAPLTAPDARLGSAVYFSFVTLTTLGYGDIVPLTAQARALALSETILGQLYLVTLVARVVGIHVATTKASDHRDD